MKAFSFFALPLLIFFSFCLSVSVSLSLSLPPSLPPSLSPQAASSGRMADLMGGDTATGFIGFEAVSRGMGGEVGGGEGVGEEQLPPSAGAEFQVVMKQLGKRDTTTKLKVKQEACPSPGKWLPYLVYGVVLHIHVIHTKFVDYCS